MEHDQIFFGFGVTEEIRQELDDRLELTNRLGSTCDRIFERHDPLAYGFAPNRNWIAILVDGLEFGIDLLEFATDLVHLRRKFFDCFGDKNDAIFGGCELEIAATGTAKTHDVGIGSNRSQNEIAYFSTLLSGVQDMVKILEVTTKERDCTQRTYPVVARLGGAD